MRLARYELDGTVRLAALDGDELVDLVAALEAGGSLSEADRTVASDATAFVASGAQGRDLAERAMAGGGAGRLALASAKLRAPRA
jgi:hypothetical protein